MRYLTQSEGTLECLIAASADIEHHQAMGDWTTATSVHERAENKEMPVIVDRAN